jgi:hypothetical protein
MKKRWLGAWVVTLAVALGQPAALAQDREHDQQAELAEAHFEAGRFREALRTFEKLYRETGQPVYLRNWARCHQKLNQPTEAIKRFEEYLQVGKDVDGLERNEIEHYLRDLRAASPKPPSVVPVVPLAANPQIDHTPATTARHDEPIEVRASIAPGLRPVHVILAYRPEGSSEYLARDMERAGGTNWRARIPGPATRGSMVSYYIEARETGGRVLASHGTGDQPHVVTLEPGTGTDPPPPPSESRVDPTLWVGFGVGTGGGWSNGAPERLFRGSSGQERRFTGLAPASLLHLTSELGYFLSPAMALTLQVRMQIVTGTSEINACGVTMTETCRKAAGAVAVLARTTWIWGESNSLQTWLTLAVGGGQIRHVATIADASCGSAACADTLQGGPLLFGPALGVSFPLTGPLSLSLRADLLAGLPSQMINLDFSAAVALTF